MNVSLQLLSALGRRPAVLKLGVALLKAAQMFGWIALASNGATIESSAPRPTSGQPSRPTRSNTERVSPKAAAFVPASDGASAELTILLVDDDPGVLKGLARVLHAQGWRVITAKDGAEALLHLSERRPDILITDLSMGDISGWDLLFHEDMQRPDLPIFVITALPPPAVDCAAALAAEFFQKPLDPETLIAAIRRRVAGSGATDKSATV